MNEIINRPSFLRRTARAYLAIVATTMILLALALALAYVAVVNFGAITAFLVKAAGMFVAMLIVGIVVAPLQAWLGARRHHS